MTNKHADKQRITENQQTTTTSPQQPFIFDFRHITLFYTKMSPSPPPPGHLPHSSNRATAAKAAALQKAPPKFSLSFSFSFLFFSLSFSALRSQKRRKDHRNSPCLASPRLSTARLVSPRLASPRLATPHIVSPRLTSIHFFLFLATRACPLEESTKGIQHAVANEAR